MDSDSKKGYQTLGGTLDKYLQESSGLFETGNFLFPPFVVSTHFGQFVVAEVSHICMHH